MNETARTIAVVIVCVLVAGLAGVAGVDIGRTGERQTMQQQAIEKGFAVVSDKGEFVWLDAFTIANNYLATTQAPKWQGNPPVHVPDYLQEAVPQNPTPTPESKPQPKPDPNEEPFPQIDVPNRPPLDILVPVRKQ